MDTRRSRGESGLWPTMAVLVTLAVASFAWWYHGLLADQAAREAELDELEWRAVTRAPGIMAEAWGLGPDGTPLPGRETIRGEMHPAGSREAGR